MSNLKQIIIQLSVASRKTSVISRTFKDHNDFPVLSTSLKFEGKMLRLLRTFQEAWEPCSEHAACTQLSAEVEDVL